MNGKLGLFTGYAVSGTTGVAGALASTAAKTGQVVNPHLFHHHLFGLEYSEVAIIVGILGTLSTMCLQFLTYRRNVLKDKINELKELVEEKKEPRDSE